MCNLTTPIKKHVREYLVTTLADRHAANSTKERSDILQKYRELTDKELLKKYQAHTGY